MKRCIAIVLAAAVMLFAFAGCSAKEVDLKAVLTEINTKCPDETAGLTELKDTDELYKYYLISPSDVKQFAASALTSRFNSIKSTYSSYSPDKLDVIEKCSVTQNENYVFMVVADNYSAVMDVINAAF